MPNAPDAESRRDRGASPLWSPAAPDGAPPAPTCVAFPTRATFADDPEVGVPPLPWPVP